MLGPLLLDLDARNLDVACLTHGCLHVIGELDGVEKCFGFFLVLIEVCDENADASRLNVGKEIGMGAAVVLARSGEPCPAVVLDGVANFPLEHAALSTFIGKSLFCRHLLFPNGDKAVDRGVFVLGEGELDSVGVLAGGVTYANALGHLDLKPDKVGLFGDGGLFLAPALGGAASASARSAPAAAQEDERGKEGDSKGKDR